MGRPPSTPSVRCAANSAIRRPQHDGQNPRSATVYGEDKEMFFNLEQAVAKHQAASVQDVAR